MAIQFCFRHESLADGADGGKFCGALLLSIEETGILEGDTHTARKRLQQAHIGFGEGVFTFYVLQTEIPVDLRTRAERNIYQGLGLLCAFDGP